MLTYCRMNTETNRARQYWIPVVTSSICRFTSCPQEHCVWGTRELESTAAARGDDPPAKYMRRLFKKPRRILQDLKKRERSVCNIWAMAQSYRKTTSQLGTFKRLVSKWSIRSVEHTRSKDYIYTVEQEAHNFLSAVYSEDKWRHNELLNIVFSPFHLN